ncbi:homing endonuclease associated repeat-containing protein [Metabacillus fastidiosus]|uniref:homing endonuclease associated repeat-containing protein n=1 Tax=Metabacillus fastidiosus TaxID=1458 RepID=UPI003D270CD3
MELIKVKFTDEEMINELKEFAKVNGRSPKMKDFKNKKPSADMISKRFGAWSNALKIAGLELALRPNDHSKETLIGYLKDFYNKYNKVPTSRDMIRLKQGTFHAYKNHFGSFKGALIEAGLFELREDKHQFCEVYTDEQLLNLLKEYMKDKDRIPTSEVLRETLSPSASTYDRRFNSIYNALKLIGYDINNQREKDLITLEDDMINKYKELKKILNKTPSSRDIDFYSKNYNHGYSMSSYEFHFGSLSELQVICGFTPTVVGRIKTKEDLINDIKMMASELGKTPSQLDIKYFENVASSSTYRKVFGTWNKAIKEAGLKQNGDIYYSSKGLECLSYYELLFTNMLEKYNIVFTKENKYKDYIATDKNYRFDYVIQFNNKQYFVEIFGITYREDYLEKTEHKIRLCKENNLDLIEIYPEDFTSYKLEDIHKMLLLKIN